MTKPHRRPRQPRFRQLTEPIGPPDFEKLLRLAGQREEPTYACIKCFDTGQILTMKQAPKSIYGANPPTVAHSRKCTCRSNRYRHIKPPDEEIPR